MLENKSNYPFRDKAGSGESRCLIPEKAVELRVVMWLKSCLWPGCTRGCHCCSCRCKRWWLSGPFIKQYSWLSVTQHSEAEEPSTGNSLFPLHPICYRWFPFSTPKLKHKCEPTVCHTLGPRAGRTMQIGAWGDSKLTLNKCLTPPGYESPLFLQQYQR